MATKEYEVDGIKVKVNPEILQDRKVMHLSVKVNKNIALLNSGKIKDDSVELAEIAEENVALSDKYFDLVFGKKQFDKIQDQIREQNDGVCTEQMLTDFIEKLTSQFPDIKK